MFFWKRQEKVVTRFAPSPTGVLHIGNARTALFNYLFAKKHNGKFLLRIEDTDKERSKKEFEEDILEGLSWLGMDFDGELVRQSERTNIYKKYLTRLVSEGKAYEAEENEQGTGKVIRFKNPNTSITFTDIIRGEITFDTTELKDFVIAKNMETPLYHLAVVIDDHETGITHVIRGEDHISNTPRQMLLQAAIGAKTPIYAHIPLILASDRSKLSKRHGAVSLGEFRKEGYLPEAVINFLALLGWHPKDDEEIFSMDELLKEFLLEKVQKGGAIFNREKLDWVNKEHMKTQEHENIKTLKQEIKTRLTKTLNYKLQITNELLDKLAPIILERINKWGDIDEIIKAGDLNYYFEAPSIDIQKLTWKDDGTETAKKHLGEVIKLLEKADFGSVDSIKKAIWNYAEQEGKGSVLWPLRYALSGRDKSPDPFTLAYVLGKEETIKRLLSATVN